MDQPKSRVLLSRRESLLAFVAAYAILAAAMVLGLDMAPTDTIRWITIALLLVYGLLMAFMPSPGSPPWRAHLYLAVQTGLAGVPMALYDDWTIFTLLYYILSAQVMILLPPRRGSIWIVIWVLITAGFGLDKWGVSGMLGMFALSGGYIFFGIFAHALVRAEEARGQSQILLEELREAHGQLQEYALRAEELAVVEERNRLAREMHDTLGHRLTVASVQLEGAQRLIPPDPELAATMVGTAREQIREALGELRSTVATLRTPVEADLHLRSSLRRLVAHFEEATGLTVHQVLPEQMPDLPDDHRLALYRAAQEALTNVQKHADANQVWLVLSARDDAVTLLVGDDGKGMSLSADQSGYGLRGLRERAAQLGGELHLEPRRGGGTQLSFRLLLPTGAEGS